MMKRSSMVNNANTTTPPNSANRASEVAVSQSFNLVRWVVLGAACVCWLDIGAVETLAKKRRGVL